MITIVFLTLWLAGNLGCVWGRKSALVHRAGPANPPVLQATAAATTAALTEKVWGEYASVVCQIFAKRNTKMSETWAKEFKIYFI